MQGNEIEQATDATINALKIDYEIEIRDKLHISEAME